MSAAARHAPLHSGSLRIAVVGSGVSGLYAAWLLHRAGHEVTVFERDQRVGGHVNTIDIEHDGRQYAIDTGFIVCNDRTYPIFGGLLRQIGVPLQDSDMSFSMHDDKTGREYAGPTLNALFAQRRNLLRPRFHRMIRDVLRFNREAPDLLDRPDELPMRDWLATQDYSQQFIDDYLIPMGAAIWSSSPERMLAFPARYFVRFFVNHGMFSRESGPQWQVVAGGSKSYVERLIEPFRDRIRVGAAVTAVTRPAAGGATVQVAGGDPESFDRVVMACHSDQALDLLADPDDAEREILGAIPFQPNEAVLHTDRRLLPKSRRAWASWNYAMPERAQPTASVTYWMNRLQGLDAPVQFLVTLNLTDRIDPACILRTVHYTHPVYTPAGIAAQRRHDEISGVRDTVFCGAYWRFGFHEDGAWSAQRAAHQLDMTIPAPEPLVT